MGFGITLMSQPFALTVPTPLSVVRSSGRRAVVTGQAGLPVMICDT